MTLHPAVSQADGHADAHDLIQVRIFEEIAATFDLQASEVTPASRLWEDYRVSLSDLVDLKARLEVAFSLDTSPHG
jgi:hypothetical protein